MLIVFLPLLCLSINTAKINATELLQIMQNSPMQLLANVNDAGLDGKGFVSKFQKSRKEILQVLMDLKYAKLLSDIDFFILTACALSPDELMFGRAAEKGKYIMPNGFYVYFADILNVILYKLDITEDIDYMKENQLLFILSNLPTDFKSEQKIHDVSVLRDKFEKKKFIKAVQPFLDDLMKKFPKECWIYSSMYLIEKMQKFCDDISSNDFSNGLNSPAISLSNINLNDDCQKDSFNSSICLRNGRSPSVDKSYGLSPVNLNDDCQNDSFDSSSRCGISPSVDKSYNLSRQSSESLSISW